MNNIVLSLVGPHAQESLLDIFKRKINDCEVVGYTFWLYRSFRCTKELYNQFKPKEVWFVLGATKNSAKQTKLANKAMGYYENGVWNHFDPNLSPVTGKLTSNTTAFKIKHFEFLKETINFNEFEDVVSNKPVKFSQFCSTKIAKYSPQNSFLKQRLRTICCKATLESVVTVC